MLKAKPQSPKSPNSKAPWPNPAKAPRRQCSLKALEPRGLHGSDGPAAHTERHRQLLSMRASCVPTAFRHAARLTEHAWVWRARRCVVWRARIRYFARSRLRPVSPNCSWDPHGLQVRVRGLRSVFRQRGWSGGAAFALPGAAGSLRMRSWQQAGRAKACCAWRDKTSDAGPGSRVEGDFAPLCFITTNVAKSSPSSLLI